MAGRWARHAGSARRMIPWAPVLCLLLGCSSSPPDEVVPIDEPEPEPEPEPCQPWELELGPGECVPSGVPPDGCAEGFEHDGDGGCLPVLPATMCPPAQMAVPGETECRPVASCGTGRWGDIPVDDQTQYVDGSYAGGDSDGSEARPWTTIADGLDAVAGRGLVAVAEGSYEGTGWLGYKSLRLQGRCPQLVEVVVPLDLGVAFLVGLGQDGVVLSGMAITGPGLAVGVSNATNVVLENLWVHDLQGGHGLEIHDSDGPTSVSVREVLIESAWEVGIVVGGGTAELDRVAIRDSQPRAAGDVGRGLHVQPGFAAGAPSIVTVQRSVIEANRHLGIFAAGAELRVEGSVIRDTLVQQSDRTGGYAIGSEVVPESGQRSQITVAASALLQNGLYFAGVDVDITDTVLRDVPLDHEQGRGILAARYPESEHRTALTVERSLIERAATFGVLVRGVEASLDRTVVRDTAVSADGTVGNGLYVMADELDGARATVSSSVLVRNHSTGILAEGSELWLERSLVADNLPRATDHWFGRGVQLQPNFDLGLPSTAEIHDCVIERNAEVAVCVVGSSATVEDTVLRESTPGLGDGWYGDGLAVVSVEAFPGVAALRRSTVVDNERAGVANFGGSIEVARNQLGCNLFALHGGSNEGHDYAYDDQGDNDCSCDGDGEACQVATAELAPPQAQPPQEEP